MTSLEPARALRHPLWWGSLLVLAVNDHLLKGAGLLPGWLTGKLSDVAGLVVAPALLATLLRARGGLGLALAHLAPLLALAALKLVPGLAEAVVAAAAAVGEPWAIVADPTDLLAAPAALLAHRVLVPAMRAPAPAGAARPGAPSARERLLVVLGAIACCATSRSAPQAPAIHRGQVVVQGWPDGELHRFDGRSGASRPPLEETEDLWIDAPVIEDGAVWVATEGTISAIDLSTGRTRWSHVERGLSLQSVEGVDEGAVYALAPCFDASCSDARWVAIDRHTRRLRWTAPARDGVAPALGEGAVAHVEGARLVVRDATSGEVRWTRTFAVDARALAIDAGVVWVVEPEPGRLWALSLADGAERARADLGPSAGVGARGWSGRSTAGADRGLLFVSVGGELRAVEATSGHVRWRAPGSSLVARDGVVVVEQDLSLTGFDGATGRSLWRIQDVGWGRVAIGDGLLAVRRGDEVVDVFDLRTGRRTIRFDLDDGEPISADD